jgi:predicted MFS family arabinose efflux permease
VIAEHGGLRVAYWCGAAMAVAALLTAAVVVPSFAHRPPNRLDGLGAAMLGAALAGLLLVISEGEKWGWGSVRLVVTTGGSLVVLGGWIVLELRRRNPLVELRLLRRAEIITADVAAVLTGAGMYLLISLVTRLVQTPTSSGYGLGGSIALAGLMLTPFSAGSVAASRVTRALVRHLPPGWVLPLGSAVLLASMVMFTFAHDELWKIAIVMGVAGLGIGVIFAVMPDFIVGSVPSRETGSALSFNQVLRYIGYGVGSSLSATVLQMSTAPGETLPKDSGYLVAGVIACIIWVVAALASLAIPRLASARASLPQSSAPQQRAEMELEEWESLASALPYDGDQATGGHADQPPERR